MALTLVACGGASAVPAHGHAVTAKQPTPAGSPDAGGQLRGAADAMTQASNFTVSGKVSAGGSTTLLAGQFQAPDVVELTITPATGAPVDVLFAGTKSFVKAADGTWKNHLTGAAGSADPRVAFSVLDKATGVTLASSSGGQRTYAFAVPGSMTSLIVQGSDSRGITTLAGTAVVTSGTISELTLTSTTHPGTFMAELHYTAVGSSPAIALPAGA
jgi:hypothetical protein